MPALVMRDAREAVVREARGCRACVVGFTARSAAGLGVTGEPSRV